MQQDNLKILATIPSGFCYGVQISTVELFSRFPRNVNSHFIVTRWNNGEFEKLLNSHDLPYTFSWLGMFSRKLDWKNIKMTIHAFSKLPRLYFDFFTIIRKFQPDILFFSNHHELILLYPVLLFTKKKIVCHMHDPSPTIPFQIRTFNFYGKLVNQFIAITDNVRSRTIKLGCNPAKIKTIHMSTVIRPERNEPRKNDFCNKANWPVNSFLIGITGQMTASKGILDLLEAYKMLYQKNSLVRLVIGGKSIEPFYTELKTQIKKWELEKLVYFPGWIPDVTTFFYNVDAYVLASRHEEGFGMVIAEAMIASVPVVITASGGAVELVDNGINGFIVEKNNPGQMAEKLYQLSINPELCKSFANAGRKKIEENFDIEKQSKAFVNLLLEVKDRKNVR